MISAVKKTLCIMIAIFVVLLSGCHKENERLIYEGMSFEEFQEKNPEDSYYRYFGGYLFTVNDEGDHIVARLSDDATVISKVDCYEAESINKADETFLKIEEGMTVNQVVSMVGIPEGSDTSGMVSLTFQSNSGSRYLVYWNAKETADGMNYVATSVLPLDTVKN